LITFDEKFAIEFATKKYKREPTNEEINEILNDEWVLSPNRKLVKNESIEWLKLKQFEYGIIG
jgi:hypothetical protein